MTTKHVLIVDDEVALADGLAAYFGRPEVEVRTVHSIDAARLCLDDHPYDLVLSDLRLGDEGREGLELFEDARRVGAGRFVLMTGFATPEVEATAKSMGIADFLPKPLDFDALDALIADLVSADEPGAAAAARLRPSDARAIFLLQAWYRNADERALEQLLKAYRALLLSIPLRWYHLDREDAEDIQQEVTIRLLQQAGAIRNVRLWLIGTAINLCRQRIGSLSKTRRISAAVHDESLRLQEIDDQRHDTLRESTQQAVRALPPRDRHLIEALYVEGLSYEEVAARFAMPIGSIGPTRGRIVRKLAAALDGAATSH